MKQDSSPRPERHSGRFRRHLVTRTMSGLFVLVPFVVTVVVLRFVFRLVSSLVSPVTTVFVPSGVPQALLVVLSVLLLVLLLYIVGTITASVAGKTLLSLSEALFLRLPLVKTIYSSTKSAIGALSMAQRATFRSVVLLQFPRAGCWSLGFVTGTTTDSGGREYYKIFVPTTPNPTSGYFALLGREDVLETELTVEKGIQTIVSGGILFPSQIPASLGRETTAEPGQESGPPTALNNEETQ